MTRRILVTGGAGFIGANFIRHWLAKYPEDRIVNYDALTYAGNLDNLRDVEDNPNYRFVHADVCDQKSLERIFEEERIDHVAHLAAESHVDRSILGPGAFVRTNVQGTFTLLDVAHNMWSRQEGKQRFLNVSTDEVYGSLSKDEDPWTEACPIQPNSPYSASKAAAGHVGRAYWHTYDTPVVTSHCTNNYGAYQFTEKLIPLVILRGLAWDQVPIYGDGLQVRDWIHVMDHVTGLEQILLHGTLGETYNVGASAERTNRYVVETILDILDRVIPGPYSRRELISFVTDRPGHDRRYAIDSGKVRKELGWEPMYSFESGIEETVLWYLNNETWWRNLEKRSNDAIFTPENMLDRFDAIHANTVEQF
jgi:dTDP-glucose 4,6-dehydratase